MNDESDRIKAIFSQARTTGPEPGSAAPSDTPAGPEVVSPGDGPASARLRFPDIAAPTYEHPADAAAMAALRKVPGFDQLLRRFVGAIGERRLRYLYLASAVRVNERQFRDVDRVFRESCEILDMPRMPELYVSQNPIVNAGAIGIDEPFVVLHSATLELYTTDELRFVIGHELGHILSEHVLYKTMLRLLLQIGLGRVGLPGLAILGVVAALKEWDRKSELSADRAGLLCLQDADAADRVLMKMAGGPQIAQMDTAEFARQADEYERGGDLRDGALKLLNLLWLSHPFPVLRLAELRRYVASGAYDAVLRGAYTRRSDLATGRVVEEWRAGAQSYRDRFAESEDPLAAFLRDLGAGVSDVGAVLREKWAAIRGGGAPPPDAPPPGPPKDDAGG
jgi:Zn-dependent protease with chaperone function